MDIARRPRGGKNMTEQKHQKELSSLIKRDVTFIDMDLVT